MCDIPGVKPPCPETGHCLAGTGHSTDLGSRREVFPHRCKIGVTLRLDQCHVGPTCPLSEQFRPGGVQGLRRESVKIRVRKAHVTTPAPKEGVSKRRAERDFVSIVLLMTVRQACHYHVKTLVEIFVNRQSKRIKAFFPNL